MKSIVIERYESLVKNHETDNHQKNILDRG